MQGKIIKGVGGLYFVFSEGRVYECKAKGIFRKSNIKPLIGDECLIELQPDDTGVICEILPRKSSLIRPEVANVTQAMLVFAATSPEPNLNLADRFLVNMEMAGVSAFVVFNKADLISVEEKLKLQNAFKGTPYDVYFISAKHDVGVGAVRERLEGQITVPAGPSGVGKSTLVNLLQSSKVMETGGLSEKIQRGKNTTRHSEMLQIGANSWIFDTPGFTSFDVMGIEAGALEKYYPDILSCSGLCRFIGCAHINEPNCEVKAAVKKGIISQNRYDNYVQLYNEIKNRKKY